MRAPACRAAVLHQLPSYLEARGIVPDPVFREGGFGALDTQTGIVVHRAQICAVLDRAARLLGETMVGVTLGLQSEPLRLGRAGLALVSGSTVGDGLRGMGAQMPAMQSRVRLEMRVEGPHAVWSHALEDTRQDGAWILYEGASALTVKVLREWLGASWAPLLVRFPHACRGRRESYEDIFGGPVRFGTGDAAEIRFDRRVLDLPIPAAGPQAGEPPPGSSSERDVLAFEMRSEGLARAVSDVIEARLADEPVTLQACAVVLGFAPRTLQRRLEECGLTFETLVDRIRQRRAFALLGGSAMTVTDVAMALGYSDSAHLVRAFRRWTGLTPSAFRAGAV